MILAACTAAPTPPPDDLPTLAQLPSATPSDTPTATLTLTPSITPTASDTPTLTATVTTSVTPSATITDTPTFTPTATASPTERAQALGLLAELAAQATVLPPEFAPPAQSTAPGALGTLPPPGTALASACSITAPPPLTSILSANPALSTALGCPLSASTMPTSAAFQRFQNGRMIWLNGPIYVLYADGRYAQFSDTFVAGVDPESGGETPPDGVFEPVRGFGKVWRQNPAVRDGLGWALAPETGTQAALVRFERGQMFELAADLSIYALTGDAVGGTWQIFDAP